LIHAASHNNEPQYLNALEQLVIHECRNCHSFFLFKIDRDQHTSDTGHIVFEEVEIDDYTLR